MENWFTTMPKIELHAHLNGSIRNSTLLELASDLGEKGKINFSDVKTAILNHDRSMVEVFKLFDVIRMVTTTHETISRITREVIEDFAADNVVYLELRTTPKNNDSANMTKKSYVEAVLNGMKSVTSVDINTTNSESERKQMYVRLLLSIDRRETTEDAIDTVALALEMRDFGVVGVDLSGNPSVGQWETFLPALNLAKQNNVPISLHCGEVPNHDEIQAMISFHPSRIGHACFFNEEEWDQLKSLRIPVEICLTSNIRTESISSLDIHHFFDLYKTQHPLILCTDDSGVFSTSPSNEYLVASSAFGLGKNDLFQLARNGIDYAFTEDKVKKDLDCIFDEFAKTLLRNMGFDGE